MTGAAYISLYRWEKYGALKPFRDHRGWRHFSERDLIAVRDMLHGRSRTYFEYLEHIRSIKARRDAEEAARGVPANAG